MRELRRSEKARFCLSAAGLAAVLLLFGCVLQQPTFGQEEVRGTITGTVTDPSNAVIPGAKVEVKSLDTGVVYSFTTNSSGLYVAPLLPVGQYAVSASNQGFKKLTEQVEVRNADRLQLDLHLEVGQSAETVEVSGQAQLLETTASLAQVVNHDIVDSLPLEGHNSFLEASTTAGYWFGGIDSINSIRPFDNGGMDSMQINGGGGLTNNFTINGLTDTNNSDLGGGEHLSYVPAPDAVQEVTSATNAYDAQNGRTGGGNINVDLKHGGNQVHGAAYWYVRNTIFNANRWENNAYDIARTPYHWNEPGVELDGPVYIPKLYNGKNKTFFMFAWERIEDSVPQPITASVPTDLQRQGNFEGTTSGGNQITIYDPLSTVSSSSGAYSRTPFPNNQIPASRINPIAANVMTYWPEPNVPGTLVNNYFDGGTVSIDKYDSFSSTVDHNINQKNRLTFTWFHGNRHQIEPNYGFDTAAATAEYLHWRINNGGQATWTAAINPTTVLDIRGGFERHSFAISPYSRGFNPEELGFSQSLVSELPGLTFPTIALTGGAGLPGTAGPVSILGLGGGAGIFEEGNTWTSQATLTKIVRTHTLKFGAQFNVILNNQSPPASSSGTYTFSTAFTQNNPLVNSAVQGDPLADMLLGYPVSGSVPFNAAFAYSQHYYALFAQDDWRVNSRVTVNLGFRWDVETPPTERYNREVVGFAFGQTGPLPGTIGGVEFLPNGTRTPYTTDYNTPQPRIGVAYRLDNKTVIRGGYGLYHIPTYDTPPTYGYTQTTTYDASNNGDATPANNLSNPYPTGILAPVGSSLGLAQSLGQSITFPYHNRAVPLYETFSAGFERQLPFNLVAGFSYVGSRTHGLQTTANLDYVSAAQLAQYGSALNGAVPNPFAGLLPGSSINGSTITLQQSLLPYPQYTGLTEEYENLGHTWYNSMQMRVEKRFSNGLSMLVSYTLSKNMQATSWLSPQYEQVGANGVATQQGLERQLVTSDVPNNLRISGTYRLPFFSAGKGFLHSALGGWQLNGIYTYQTGTPLTAPSGAFSTGVNPAVKNPTWQHEFNTCYINLAGVDTDCAYDSRPAWIQQPAFTLNTLTPVLPNIRNFRPPLVDFSLFKSFPIKERMRLQIRAEAFNLCNTVWFPAPQSSSLTSAVFGQMVVGGTFGATSNDPRTVQLSARVTF